MTATVTKSTKRAALYIRAAQEASEHSIAQQHESANAYAALHGMGVVEAYTDIGSGAHLEGRDGLKQLLEDAQSPEKGFDVVLCTSLDRLSRNVRVYDYSLGILKKSGIEVRTCSNPAPAHTERQRSALRRGLSQMRHAFQQAAV